MKRHVRVGSRDSLLARLQSEIFLSAVGEANPDIAFELVTMKTTGDIVQSRSLSEVGGKGLFVKELDAALINGEIDISVSSLKDLPSVLDPRLPIVWHSPRENPLDCLALPSGESSLRSGLPIGTSSPRRQIQLSALYPQASFQMIRGNVQTRLSKLEGGAYAATAFAMAALARLGLTGRASRVFSLAEVIPSAGQGIVAAQCREDFDASFLASSDAEDSRAAATAERAFVGAMNGDCTSPLAAHLAIEGEAITLYAMSGLGPEMARTHLTGRRGQERELGERAAEILLEKV